MCVSPAWYLICRNLFLLQTYYEFNEQDTALVGLRGMIRHLPDCMIIAYLQLLNYV
jgi:hypothetical protein